MRSAPSSTWRISLATWPLALVLACAPREPSHPPLRVEKLSAAHQRYHDKIGDIEHTETPSPAPEHAPSPAPPPASSPANANAPSPQPDEAPSPSTGGSPSPSNGDPPDPITAAALPPRSCGRSAWLTYGHDAGRTSATDACLDPPLRVEWTFVPPEREGRKGRVEHSIADGESVFTSGVRDKSAIVHRLDARNAHVQWAFEGRTPGARAAWPNMIENLVILVDDRLHVLRHDTGTATHDGPAAAWTLLWRVGRTAPAGVARFDVDRVARDGDRLFFAPRGHGHEASYLSAFNAKAGKAEWRVSAAPESAPSAHDGRVFLIERTTSGGHTLIARTQTSGAVAWSFALEHPRASAPVVAGSRILVHLDSGIVSLDAASGKLAWCTSMPSKASASRHTTSIAAALGSSTVLVTASNRAHILSLQTGEVLWTFEPSVAKDIHSPIIVNNTAYLTVDGALVRLDGTPG